MTWRGKHTKLVVCLAALGYLLLATGSVRTKLPWLDEGLFASPALNLITNGYMGTSVMETAGTPWKGIERHTYWVMPLHILAQAGWYRIFGFGLFSMRAMSVLWGLIALVAWYGIAEALSGDDRVAALAFAFLALDGVLISSASSGRMDMMNAALGAAGLATYLGWRERYFGRAILASNGLVAASGLTHPNGILYLAMLLFLTLYLDRSRIRWRHLGLAIIPYFAGAAGWGLYVLEDRLGFMAQFGANLRNGSRLNYLSAPWRGVRAEFVDRYLGYFGLSPETSRWGRLKLVIPIIEMAAMAGFIGSPGMRRQSGYRALFVLTLLTCAMLAVYDGQKLPYYLVHIVPALDVMVAAWLVYSWSRRSVPPWTVGLAAGVFLTLQFSISAYRIAQNPYAKKYLPAIAFLKQNTSQDSLVMASSSFDFGLGFDGRILDDPRLGYYSRKTADFIVVGEVDYAQYLEDYKNDEPAVHQYIVRRLASDYRLVYDQVGNKIYAHR